MFSRTVVIAVLLALCFCGASFAQSQCSISQVVGNWSYHVSGWDIPSGGTAPVQMLFIGVLSIDWSGKVTGPGTFAMGAPLAGTPIPAGQALDYDFVSGSIQLTPDCTGLLSTMMKIKGSRAPPMGPYIGRIIVLPDQGEIVAMSFRAPGTERPMWTYILKRMTPVPSAVEWPQPQP
jgi:hypothetical protein